MSNFSFLDNDFPAIADSAKRAEMYAPYDPRSACFYGRRTLELVVNWLYDHDSAFRRPYDPQATLATLMHERSFEQNIPLGVRQKAHTVRKLGNLAVHDTRPVRQLESATVLKEVFQVLYWLARTYQQDNRAVLPVHFDPRLIPASPEEQQEASKASLQKLEADLAARDKQAQELLAREAALKAELDAMRAQVTASKQRNARVPDEHDYSRTEQETREVIIDLLLREVGWDPAGENVAEYPVTGLAGSPSGKGRVDYVLWGDDGNPLAVVEAKRTSKDSKAGKQQAVNYADCLEASYGQRPLIFYTNGYDIWLWDDARYPERKLQGFLTKDEMQRAVQRRRSAQDLAQVSIDQDIVNRYYQTEAVRRVNARFSQQFRKALLVMATGTGKTRTAIALVDVLMRAGWVKRVLFLADRKALVDQAVGAFKRHLPASSPVNLLSDKEAAESRLVVSTYHTMMGLIDARYENDKRLFGVGHFDLIIVDEAHRSIYRSFGTIFDYFDSLLVGLTATPKDEVDRNTYDLFNLESGLPTYAYDLTEAVKDQFLVPPRPISTSTKFLREGIKYDALSSEEQEHWDELEWSADGHIPTEVRAAELNTWLFNENTVDKVLKTLMTEGIKVAAGDRLGKTIIFAHSHDHALYIEERFNKHYPKQKGRFARVIDTYEPKAAQLMSDFGKPDGEPVIAISVDMLDTGIDVPAVVNLLFFKLVRSKTKFFQMLGRGTRLCPDLFAVGEDKQEFKIFDACQNFEFFNYNPKGMVTKAVAPLSQRIFNYRLELLALLSKLSNEESSALTSQLCDALHAYVAGMHLDNFIVRAKRQYVEPFQQRERWDKLSQLDLSDLQQHVSGLPSDVQQHEEGAKRFDALVLQLQLAKLEQASVFKRHQNRLMEMAQNLASKSSVPVVALQMETINNLQTDNYWQALDVAGLEQLRVSLRDLVQFIDKPKRNLIYSNFEDESETSQDVSVSYLTGGVNHAQYRQKVEHFLREHQRDDVMIKLCKALPLTSLDLEKLEALVFASGGVESRETFEQVYGKQDNLGLFIRRLVGLDRRAAKEAFGRFLDDSCFTADQIQFINNIIDHLTKNGTIDPKLLYERPFTDVHEEGLDGVFADEHADEVVAIIRQLDSSTGLTESSLGARA